MSVSPRARVAQGMPSRDLSDFPSKTFPPGRHWFRQHSPAGPWFFDSSLLGRFNVPTPRGTLYVASTADGAARERIGFDVAASGWVPAGLVEGRVMSTLTLPVTVKAAHLTAEAALQWGVVANELAATDDYVLTQAWADAFDHAGFDGLWSRLRFTAGQGRGLAVFGAEGARSWPVDPHPRLLREVVETDMGLMVVDLPPSSGLTIIH